MFELAALERSLGFVVTRGDTSAGAGRGGAARTDAGSGAPETGTSGRESGPKITAELESGPLGGRRIEVDVVEGRPPKTIDVRADDGSMCRYCLEGWAQSGPSARYTFLYRV
jgi:hypothetical protein